MDSIAMEEMDQNQTQHLPAEQEEVRIKEGLLAPATRLDSSEMAASTSEDPNAFVDVEEEENKPGTKTNIFKMIKKKYRRHRLPHSTEVNLPKGILHI
mgnify:CR=1 FL=1